MISLEIAISNFKSLNYQQQPISQVTLKFGQISTIITLTASHGGKCLYLDLTPEELQQIYFHYACGLFILNRSGKYFSLLSFERIRIEDKIICNDITFFNDCREAKFNCEFSIVVKDYKNPRLANTEKFQTRQNALDMLKKPPIPKQTPPFQKSKQKKPPQAQINSFLYGNKHGGDDNLQTLKEDLRRQSQIKSNLQKTKQQGFHTKNALAKKQQQNNEDDNFQFNPPMMEFTNEEEERPTTLQVPQIDYIQYEESIENSKQNSRKRQSAPPSENKFLTFNKNQKSKSRQVSPQTPSEFQLLKKQKNLYLPSKNPNLSKQQIKRIAKEQAQSRQLKQNVMIPIARGNKFQLLPLSALKPEEIIEYVQRQRRQDEEAYSFQLRKKKLEEREREIEQKNNRFQQLARLQKQKQLAAKKPSKQNRTSIIHKQEIKEQDNDSEQKDDDDYMQDFESMSASNSAIRSRISSRGNPKNNVSKQEESVAEDDYSQDFDSYSHSMLSKTNLKNQVNNNNVSDYSQSYNSISQSYRK